jgi:flavin reductase (DIM6/NTAB) family NADH-FMN oxidoreductase RutF
MSPVALECKVRSVTELGTHDLILAEVVANKVDIGLVDDQGKILLGTAELLAYSHGEYFGLKNRPLGTFGYAVARRATRQKKHQQKINMQKGKKK